MPPRLLFRSLFILFFLTGVQAKKIRHVLRLLHSYHAFRSYKYSVSDVLNTRDRVFRRNGTPSFLRTLLLRLDGIHPKLIPLPQNPQCIPSFNLRHLRPIPNATQRAITVYHHGPEVV